MASPSYRDPRQSRHQLNPTTSSVEHRATRTLSHRVLLVEFTPALFPECCSSNRPAPITSLPVNQKSVIGLHSYNRGPSLQALAASHPSSTSTRTAILDEGLTPLAESLVEFLGSSSSLEDESGSSLRANLRPSLDGQTRIQDRLLQVTLPALMVNRSGICPSPHFIGRYGSNVIQLRVDRHRTIFQEVFHGVGCVHNFEG
jgi:hypothetical protein